MSKRRSDVDVIANAIADALAEHVTQKYGDLPEDDPHRDLMATVLAEHTNRQLHARVRRYLRANPLILAQALRPRNRDGGWRVWQIGMEILWQIGLELVDTVVGKHPIPRGIEEGDCWLAPSTELQRMFQDRHGEDAVVLVVAKRGEDGQLGPSFCWTTSEEMIADAQRGHRRYMELLAKQAKT